MERHQMARLLVGTLSGLVALSACGPVGAPELAGIDAEDAANIDQDLRTCPVTDRGYVKWYPGNYIYPIAAESSFVKSFGSIPAVKGMQKGYFWHDLEPSLGVYDWSQIDADLARLAPAKKKLAIIINYKYQISDTVSSLPDYILAYPNATVNGVSVPPYFEQGKANDGPFNHGQHANFGHPKTRARFKALLNALSARYDSNPNLVSLTFIETSVGADISDAQQDLFLNGIMNIERHASCVLLHTPVFQNLNFPRKRLSEFATNLTTHGVGLGGPDVFFDSMKDPENSLGYNVAGKPKGIYHYYPQLSSIVPIGQQIHYANFLYSTHESMKPAPGVPHNLSPSISVSKLYNFSMQQLKPNYLFWFIGGSSDEYATAVKARLQTDGLPLLTDCPSVYAGKCSSL